MFGPVCNALDLCELAVLYYQSFSSPPLVWSAFTLDYIWSILFSMFHSALTLEMDFHDLFLHFPCPLTANERSEGSAANDTHGAPEVTLISSITFFFLLSVEAPLPHSALPLCVSPVRPSESPELKFPLVA